MKKLFLSLVFLIIPVIVSAQTNSFLSQLKFNSDFRFRVEQDWDSKKSDGSFRDDRTRLRYRIRTGVTYATNRYEAGFRIRTGNPKKQQDPQLTLGDGSKEFGTLPIGIEKAYFQATWNSFKFWVGKNTFPFEKSNELFWSDNVYPEGVSAEKNFTLPEGFLNSISLKGGHYIIATSNRSLDTDAYFQGLQISTSVYQNKLTFFPSLYIFKNIPNIPDGNDTFLLNYSILHLGSRLVISKTIPLNFEVDYYKNLEDYNNHDDILNSIEDQNSGIVIGLKYGKLAKKGDWHFSTTYANLQRFSVVDFLAQNDWGRWDYSSQDSPDGRLTNYKGIEAVVAYKLENNINLKMKYYTIKQLIPLGTAKETGSRIRFDIDIKF